MAQVRQYTVYKFDELTPEQQDKAIEKLADINVDHDWWDFLYSDAETIGLEIEEFDTDRGIKGRFTKDPDMVANLILFLHGEACDTYKTAKSFLDEWSKYNDENDLVGTSRDLEETNFKYALLQDYLTMLNKEYDYLTSREAIIKTIQANDYDFKANSSID